MLLTTRTLKLTPEEVEQARQTLSVFSESDSLLSQVMIQLTVEDSTQSVELPQSISLLLHELLTTLAEGHGIVVMPENTDLTTAQAADILNVSRPFLVGLLESGEIPFHKVGTHRRVNLEDVLAYKDQYLQKSRERMDELSALSQDDGLYDL